MNIHVAYTIDIQGNGALQFKDQLIVGLHELKQTKREEDALTVHILYSHIPGDLIIKCQKMQTDKFIVEFIEIKPGDLNYMQKFTKNNPTANVRTWNGIVFARLWIPRAIKDVDRVIYLDIDTMVRKSLHELYSYDLQGKKLGLTMGHTIEYGFNSGVMLINCSSMRNDNDMWLKLDEFMTKHTANFYLPDQTTINQFFRDEICELPLKYNYPPKPASSNVSPIANELEDAVIWHFYFPGPKQHRLDEYERCNVLWNSILQTCEKQ